MRQCGINAPRKRFHLLRTYRERGTFDTGVVRGDGSNGRERRRRRRIVRSLKVGKHNRLVTVSDVASREKT